MADEFYANDTKERVALDLMKVIRTAQGQQKTNTTDGILDLYAECLITIQSPGNRVRD